MQMDMMQGMNQQQLPSNMMQGMNTSINPSMMQMPYQNIDPSMMQGMNPSMMQMPYQNMDPSMMQMQQQLPNSMMNTLYGGSKQIENKDQLNQEGGGQNIKAPYRREKNTPYTSHDSKNTYKRRSAESKPYEPPVLLEQKIYEPRAGKSKPGNMEIYPPAHVPVPNPYYPLMNPMYAYGYKPNRIPVQKVYNVSLANPAGDHSSLSVLYEDMLPGKDYAYSFNTLSERMSIIEFLRSTMITRGDGEEMDVTGGKNSLLSYLKLIELNPYNNRKYGGNPYSNLPDRMLLYSSAYPIRYEMDYNSVSLAKENTALNVRIYELNKAEVKANTLDGRMTKLLFDVWRELQYYQYIKEDIIKKKVCPNFISLVLHKKDTKSNINFSKLRTIKRNRNSVNTKDRDELTYKEINNRHDVMQTEIIKKITMNNNALKENMAKPSATSLIVVTEAPTHNFINWSSRIYERHGSVRKMVSTGYHTEEIWQSIIFQLLLSMSVLQEKNIHFHNFSLEDNVYVKDIYYNTEVLGFWKYVVDGIPYYIPNHGYILLIDSNYKDTEPEDVVEAINKDIPQQHKLISTIFDVNNNLNPNPVTEEDIKKLCYQDFKNVFDPSNFGLRVRQDGFVEPSSSILTLFSKIFNDNSMTKVKDYIHKYMRQFLHNRVGSYLSNFELEKLQNINRPKFIKGELVGQRIR